MAHDGIQIQKCTISFPQAVSAVTRVTRCSSEASLAHVGAQNQPLTFGVLQAVSAATRIARCSSEASLAHVCAQNQKMHRRLSSIGSHGDTRHELPFCGCLGSCWRPIKNAQLFFVRRASVAPVIQTVTPSSSFDAAHASHAFSSVTLFRASRPRARGLS